MRRIYFTPDTITHLSVAALALETSLWEAAYDRVMAAPAGATLRRFWQHQFGAEAEMTLSGAGLLALQSDIRRLLPLCRDYAELHAFLYRWSAHIDDACAQQWQMVVIAE